MLPSLKEWQRQFCNETWWKLVKASYETQIRKSIGRPHTRRRTNRLTVWWTNVNSRRSTPTIFPQTIALSASSIRVRLSVNLGRTLVDLFVWRDKSSSKNHLLLWKRPFFQKTSRKSSGTLSSQNVCFLRPLQIQERKQMTNFWGILICWLSFTERTKKDHLWFSFRVCYAIGPWVVNY